ncbi:MAG TPA: dihydrolipoamide acetyltransferase family protein [Anaerolineales bacterium]|nr:dihydrolipoamide acetyltransferase family protein [Anaerolineales bacterium]
MAIKVLVPLLGEGVEEVTVTKWLKKEGDSVDELEPLLEVNTDKVDTEIPAPASGMVLKIVAVEGAPAKVGAILAFIGKPGESVEGLGGQGAGTKSQKTERPDLKDDLAPRVSSSPMDVSNLRSEIGFISPVVAKIAAEHGVNLQQVQGTGLNGRITKNDVLNYVQNGNKTIDNRPQTMSQDPSSMVHPQGDASSRLSSIVAPTMGDQLIKHTVIRKQIAEHMVLSKQTSPHVLTVMEADMSRVVRHRLANKDTFARDGVNLTFTAYFMLALVAGLKAYPHVNSSWIDEGILVHKAVNLGMATSLGEEGLIVPVIKNADDLSLLAMARAVNDLANRARAKKLQPDDVKGGTFTLTNHGISGSLLAFPVINQPQCGILGVGALQKRVVVIDDAIAIRPMVYLSFVFDHRILDGASADWFLAKVKETLENWS